MNGPLDSSDPGNDGSIALSIAVAVQGAQDNLPSILAALPAASGVEILICHANDEPIAAHLLKARPDIRVVAGRAGALIPEMWRDGFVAAQGTWVATLTAHCPPASDWLSRALALTTIEATQNHAAFGGPIVGGPQSDPVTRAIHLLRYADADRINARREVSDLSADNALYRRREVMRCADLLPDGFWEPGYHARFVAAGLTLEVIPDLIVTHCNRYTAAEFRAQRRKHGRVFGRHRSEPKPKAARWAMFLLSPAAFPVFAFKQTRKVLSRPPLRVGFLPAALPFFGFIGSWCLGEARGYADALRGRSSGAEQ